MCPSTPTCNSKNCSNCLNNKNNDRNNNNNGNGNESKSKSENAESSKSIRNRNANIFTEEQDNLGYSEENAVYREKKFEHSPTENYEKYVAKIKWPDFIAQLFLHAGALYGLYLMIFYARFYTFLWGKF